MSARMGFGCDKHGLPGDGTTYQPPNTWDPAFESLRHQAEPFHFGNVIPAFALEPPPAAPSAIAAELAYLRRLATQERPLLMPAINAENYRITPVFERALGIDTAPAAAKQETLDLLDILGETVKFWSVKAKDRFNRPRPVQLASDLDPPFCPGHASYPSGHAGESYTLALALIDALDRRPRLHGPLLDAAVTIGRHREVAGVHYPSDSECGRRLASQLVAALRADRGYQGKIATARAELEALIPP